MKTISRSTTLTFTALAAIAAPLCWDYFAAGSEPFTGHADPQALQAAYQRWQSGYEAGNGERELNLALGYANGLSRERTDGQGRLRLDLESGELTAEVRGTAADRGLTLWLVDRGESVQAKSTPADQAFRVGEFSLDGDTLKLRTRLDRQALWGFKMDMVVVAPSGSAPQEKGLLFGSPGLFQRLYYGDRPWTVAQIGQQPGRAGETDAPAFAFLLPKAAVAGDHRRRGEHIPRPTVDDLVAKGRKLFTEETFGGNGRTCSTCHRLDNNHTIDPKYIAKLPNNDPLFVAENNPELKDLENPKLLRQFGLILANIDGFEPLPGDAAPPPGVFRSVPYTLALSQSTALELPASGGEFPQDQAYFDATQGQAEAVGWSQDGAPLDHGGSLRAFTIGAIAQHFPKTLARVPGTDFRVPSESELDAIEAYLRALGRPSDVPLASLTFKSEVVERGKQLFDTKQNPTDASGQPIFGNTANCNGCHMNAGANSSTTFANPTRDTGVERMRDQPHHLVEASAPFDGGFGQVKLADCGPDFNATCYSDGSEIKPSLPIRPGHPFQSRYNTPSLYEAADTAPFFHNNSVNTIEEAVAFYSTEAFNNSPGAFTSSGKNRQNKLDSSQVVAVSAFLRALNVGENIRSANSLAYKALSQRGEDGRESARLAAADTEDAVEVLEGMQLNLYPEALDKLQKALLLEKGAALSPVSPLRNNLLQKAIKLKMDACVQIVNEQAPFFCKAPDA